MKFAVIAFTVAVLGSMALTCASSSRSQRMAGMLLNDWCDGVDCLIPGTECVADPTLEASSVGFKKFCKCKNTFTEYASSTGGTKDRCAAKATTDLTVADCENDLDCQSYGKNIACKYQNMDDRFGKCTCNPGYVFDPAATLRSCKVFNCYDDPNPAKCDAILKGSTCVPKTAPANAGKCLCPAGKVLSGGECKDFATALACNEAANQYCPATGTGTLTCVAGKCVCQLKAATGATIAASPVSNPDNQAQVDCKANTIGSECTAEDQCPTNAACKGAGGGGKGRCICKDFHKVVLMGAIATCEPAVGSCCRGASECGMQPAAAAKGLVCLKPYPGDPRGVCNCPKGLGWNSIDKTCTASC